MLNNKGSNSIIEPQLELEQAATMHLIKVA